MIRDLRDAARRARVLVFFGFLAWLFGVNPPGWQRVLLAVLAAVAIAADVFLDDFKTRVPRPRFDTAA